MQALSSCGSQGSSGCCSIGRLCASIRQRPIASALAAIAIAGLVFCFSPNLVALKAKFGLLLTPGAALLAITALALAGVWYFCLRNCSAPSSIGSAAAKQGPTDAKLFEELLKIASPVSDENQALSQVVDCRTEDFQEHSSIPRGMHIGKDDQGCQFILVQGWRTAFFHESVTSSYGCSVVIYLNEKNELSVRKDSVQGLLLELFEKDQITSTLQVLAKSKKIEKSAYSGKVELTIEQVVS